MRIRMSKFMRISADADPDAKLRYTSSFHEERTTNLKKRRTKAMHGEVIVTYVLQTLSHKKNPQRFCLKFFPLID